VIGTLYIIATPIGNREDITLRALRILSTVPVIACEDTRRTGLLLDYYRKEKRIIQKDNKPKLISFYDEIEETRTPEIIEILQSGQNIALVSDAGTPLISDPGFKLVRECHRQNINVSPIPGPSSVTAALSVSGMPTDTFFFIGYLPKKSGKRMKLLENIKVLKSDGIVKTVILFETPHRIGKTLTELQNVLGDSEIAVATELTKMYEKIWRGKISEATSHFKNPKGEMIMLI
jgi:16S rRNA (cytidine1402-2'-O)-methyltransferase